MHILGLPTDIFNVYPASVKFKTYQARWQIGDIYVSGDARKTEDNPQGLGCYLVMTGKTVYIGAGKSGLSYRFYDKDKEVCSRYNKTLDEVGSWKRTEMQLRDDKAHAFAMTFKDRPLELGELAFGLLANNLRFVVANRNESNKSRWKTCRFWERFLGAVEVLKLQVSKPYNSLEETQQWLTEGGVISAVKSFYFLEEHDALGGLEKVGTMLDKARYSTSLSSKLTAHLQRINRTDLIPYIQYDTKHGKGGI